jgi:HprK-related kinase A
VLIGELSASELAQLLRGPGIHLVTGAFTVHVRAPLTDLAADFAQMYGDFPVDDPPGIDDARIVVGPASFVRRFIAPQARSWIEDTAAFGPVPADRAFTLLETSLNWSVAISDVAPMIMHAAVLERDGRALLLPAPSASGKSTLCAALAWRGWRLLSDEMAVFGLDDGRLRPNPRPVSLKNNAVATIAAFEPRAQMSRIFRGTPKGDVAYMRPPSSAVGRAQERATPGIVVSPRYSTEAPASIERLERVKAFDLLAENSVNYASLLQTGFDILTGIIERCDAYRMTYSNLDRAVDAIDRLHRESMNKALV